MRVCPFLELNHQYPGVIQVVTLHFVYGIEGEEKVKGTICRE